MDRPRDPLPTRVDLCPPLPPGYGDALDAGLRALGVRLTEPARSAIDGHVRLLLAWNAAINLTSIRDPVAIAQRHVLDSLTALRVFRDRRIDRFVDLGSGGGYPGIPLAAALPADRALLVDSIAKKARFLETAIAAVGLEHTTAAAAARAEALADAPADRGQWPAVTVRAVAPLAELVELALPLLRPGGILVAWKTGEPDDRSGPGAELAAARRALAAIDPGGWIEAEPATATADALADLAGHRLVVVGRGGGPIARTWPREAAVRRRRPW